MKIYEYNDLLVQVPAGVTHLMIGADGVLRGYRNRPDMSLPRPGKRRKVLFLAC
jgi:hypothetical protein